MAAHEEFNRLDEAVPGSNRSFGFVFAIAFVVIGVLPLRRGRPIRAWALALGALFLLTALLKPGILQPLNRAWFQLGLLLGKIVNPIVLSLVFFLVFTPAALLLRLFGKDLLRLRPVPGSRSYWILRQPPGPDAASMSAQF